MLIQFTIGNFCSFRENKTFSMLASSDSTNEEGAVYTAGKLRLLKSASIYGANGSGKTSLIKAMFYFNFFINSSSKEGQVSEKISWVKSFKFNTESENKPSFFEAVFILNNKRYRYGFEIDNTKVHSEWLFESKTIKNGVEKELFTRNLDGIFVKKDFVEGKDIEKKTRDNALFLSVVANFNGEKSTDILKYFEERFFVVSGLRDQTYKNVTLGLINNNQKEEIINFLNAAKIGIDDVNVTYKTFSQEDATRSSTSGYAERMLGKEIVDEILMSHKKFDDKYQNIGLAELQLDMESRGTQKLFNLSGLLVQSLKNGGTLVVDELDTSLHPKMTEFIIRLFNSRESNPNNAQLIFATHDVNLLNLELIRRDQVWFTEKNKFGETDLYSLLEYKPRNDASLEKGYMMGRYGAIPCIDFESFKIA